MNYPGSPRVALAWLATLNGLPADATGSDLPGNPSSWASQGFVQVPFSTGGSPGLDAPMRAPTVQVDCWTNRPNSEDPPWQRAEHMAGWLVARMTEQRTPVDLDLGDGYFPVRLHSIWALTEPRRITGDPSRFARVQFDAEMRWVVLDG